MASSEEIPEKHDQELSEIADAYLRARKDGAAASIESLVEKYPHLGEQLRESLEAIDLLSASPREPMPEQLGDFQIQREIGRGGMGIVYLATQISLQRKVALKVLQLSNHDSAESERFAKEAQIVAALHHERIVPIYAAGELEGTREKPICHYFAMQWIDGESIAQLIAKRSSVELSSTDKHTREIQIAKWGAQIAEALAYAHHHGVVHRDIKPSNLIVDHEQRIWLTDFGLARHDDDQTSPLIAYQGTPKYMSPEQAAAIAAPVDHRTDIYSLGVTLIEWLTGQSVVGGSNPVESLTRLQHNITEEPRTLMRGFSLDLVAVLEKCIARDPRNRYQSVEELASDLHAFINQRPVSARQQNATLRLLSEAINQKTVVRTAITSIAAIALMWLGSAGWRAYTTPNLHPVIFESSSGEWLTVNASDALGNPITSFTVPGDEVLLPGTEVRLDVSASQRLGYRRTINPTSSNAFARVKGMYLDEPQKQRWMLDDILWYECCDIIRDGESLNCCIALRPDGLVLLDTNSGKSLWSFYDDRTQWGKSVRGCPSSFQPDRCVVIEDVNGNDCQELVFAHPHRPELLCLDSSSGEQLWRTNLIDSAGILTPNPLSICPIVMQQLRRANEANLCVVVAPYDPALAATNRWLISVDPVNGNIYWYLASQQSLANSTNVTMAGARPLHLQWGEVEKRPLEFGQRTTFRSVDEYWLNISNSGLLNPYENNLRLGTDRPFSLAAIGTTTGDTAAVETDRWHWIDGQDWHKIDARSGELVKTWKLPSDCVCSPRLLRTTDGRTLVLTAQQSASSGTDFAAWDGVSDEPVWKRTLDCELGRLPQSYLSPESDFPIVVDLDGDGADEWIAPYYVPGTRYTRPMAPPYGMVMAHRGFDGESIWNEPFHLPHMDEMVERGVVVSDQDKDGWKDLLLGSRFQGGGVQGGVACFVDLVSGKTGQRIWHSQVRTESSKPTLGPNELVELTVLEEQRLIAVVTHCGIKAYDVESSRPYSTTFLNLDNGEEEAFGLGIRATSFSHERWLEHRLPPDQSQQASSRTRKLVGWDYPVLNVDSIDQLTLWRTDDYGVALCADIDRDGFPEVLGHKSKVGYSEYALLNGLTGKTTWSRRIANQKTAIQGHAIQRTAYWHELELDVDKDGLDDLAVLLSDADYGSPRLSDDQLQFATVEIVSGATGKTIWKHSATELGMVNPLAFFKQDSGRIPMLIYQHDRSNKVTCVDLNSRRTAWESNSFNAKLQQQAFETWVHDGKTVWISANESEQGNANFVNACTGEVLLQFPIGQRPATPWSTWIEWDGRELLPIQTITECPPSTADSAPSYRTDLWLVDRSIKLVGHWSETTCNTLSPVVANWFQKSNYDLPLPTVVKTQDNKELLAIPTAIDESIGYRLLGWNDDEPPSIFVDRTVRLPIDPKSMSAAVIAVDGNGDGYTDYVSLSDSGLDCTTATGETLWHRPPSTARLCGAVEKEGRRYLILQTESQTFSGSVSLLDACTGDVCDVPTDDPTSNALNAKNSKHASLIVYDQTTRTSNGYVASIRRIGTRIPRTGKLSTDPRYVCRLPWVVVVRDELQKFRITTERFSLFRLLKLAIGIYLLPAIVLWNCKRQQFSIRTLLLISAIVALVVALIAADKSSFPTDENSNSYISALGASLVIAIGIFLFALPFMELRRAGWRRVFAISVYVFFVVSIPSYLLLSNRSTTLPLTYTYSGFWHIFWYAIFPTGIVLFLVLSLVTAFKWLTKIGKWIINLPLGIRLKPALPFNTSGDSHAG